MSGTEAFLKGCFKGKKKNPIKKKKHNIYTKDIEIKKKKKKKYKKKKPNKANKQLSKVWPGASSLV